MNPVHSIRSNAEYMKLRERDRERARERERERVRERERESERAPPPFFKKKPVDNHDDSVIINAPVILNCQARGLRNIIVIFILYNNIIIIVILN
jgi:hypothetical protein